MRRTALLLAVVLAAGFTGCSVSDDEPTVEVTPADVPSNTPEATSEPRSATSTVVPMPEQTPTARQNATFRGVEMPPGTDERGILNEVALFEGHRTVLERSGIAIEFNRTSRTWVDGNLTNWRVTRGTGRTSTSAVRYRFRTIRLGQNSTTEMYVANGTRFIRETGDSVPYRTSNVTVDLLRENLAIESFRSIVTLQDWIATGTATRDGREVIVFEVDGDPSANGTLLVDSRGVVHELEYERTMTRESPEFHFHESHELALATNVTVEPPSWLAQAKNATQ
ncbi:MAG: hypothetical protein V5A34_06855 [Halapricum sp.]